MTGPKRHDVGVRVEVAGSGLSWSGKGFVAGLPIATGAVVICVVAIGVLATGVALVIGVPLAFLALEGVARLGRSRARKRSVRPGLLFAAEASMSGVPGTLAVSRDAIEWRGRRAGQASVSVPVSHVSEVVIRPIRLLFFQAARVSVSGDDGQIMKMAVTAPAQELRAALASVTTD